MKFDLEIRLFVEMGLDNMYFRPDKEEKDGVHGSNCVDCYEAIYKYWNYGFVKSTDIPIFSFRF